MNMLRSSRWALAIAVALAALCMLAPVSAAPRNTRRPALERAYERNQKLLAEAQAKQAKATSRGEWFTAWIASVKAKGKDVSALDSELKNFHKKLKLASDELGKAGALLNAHAGFDDSGKVSDAAAAQATVAKASKAIQKGQGILRDAHASLRKAIAKWHKANPDIAYPTLPRNE